MRSSTPRAPRFVNQVKSVSTGLAATKAKMRTTVSARTDCVSEATHGELYATVPGAILSGRREAERIIRLLS